MGDELREVYREYLERMYLDSDELSNVDATSIPEGISMPKLEEWAFTT